MNSPIKVRIAISMLLLFLTFGCKSEKIPELGSLNLMRGDLALCGSEGFGDVNFATSSSVVAQETFNLGISLLHSFEYDEAEKAFVKVIDEDPKCVMAYWGVAMSNFHSLWAPPSTQDLRKGSDVLKIAKSLPQSERESDYLDAINVFYTDWQNIDHKTRVRLFEKEMEGLFNKYKEDTEAAIFYSLALIASADPKDKTYTNQIKSGKILESIFPDQPNHPGVAHYIIHNYDYPELAKKALKTARIYAQIAPASAHAQHMPSHIFTRLGLWNESISSNLVSTDAAVCYVENGDNEGHWDEEIHGMDYLVYAYLQIADNKKADEQLEYLKSFKDVFPKNFKIAYAAAAIPARIALENKDWPKAANIELPSLDLPWEKFPWQKSIVHFARAMGSIRLGDILSAESELETIKTYKQELVDLEDVYKSNQLQIQIEIVQAWINYKSGNIEEAITLMTNAAENEDNTAKHPVTPGEVLPARELLGDLFLEMNKYEQALEVYEGDFKVHPNRFNGIYGAAVASSKIGNMDKANKYFNQLIKLTKTSNSDRKELIEAKEFIKNI